MHLKKIILSAISTLLAFGIINGLIIAIPFWKYILIELIITLGWKLTEYELKKI